MIAFTPLLLGLVGATSAVPYPWLSGPAETIESRVSVPPGWKRVQVSLDSFAAWLRGLPVKPGRPDVRLFDGQRKRNQEAHHLVLDVDVGKRDRQQCADAVIRLRAEFQHQAGHDGDICFPFTDGAPARWEEWKHGLRPHPG